MFDTVCGGGLMLLRGLRWQEWFGGNIYIERGGEMKWGKGRRSSKSNVGVLVLLFFLVKNSGFCLDLRGTSGGDESCSCDVLGRSVVEKEGKGKWMRFQGWPFQLWIHLPNSLPFISLPLDFHHAFENQDFFF